MKLFIFAFILVLTSCHKEIFSVIVLEKIYSPSRSSTGSGFTSGGSVVFTSDSSPEEFILLVKTKDEVFSYRVGASDYASIRVGDSINVERIVWGIK